MNKLLTLLCTLSLFPFAFVASAQERKLNSFESERDIENIRGSNANVSLTSGQGVTSGNRALKIDFNKSTSYATVTWMFSSPMDWKEYGAMLYDITNTSTDTALVVVRVDDAEKGDGRDSIYFELNIPPGQTYNAYAPFAPTQKRLGMIGSPYPEGTTPALTKGPEINFGHIYSVTFFMRRPTKAYSVVVDNLRLIKEFEPVGIVDAFGQYTKGDWKGKIKREDDLKRANLEEEASLAKQPRSKHFDSYGGWLEGPTLKSTGHFRTEKVGDQWWLVTPEGKLFFSIGICSVRMGDLTIVEGREPMFAKIPDDETFGKYLKKNAGKQCYNFYEANLRRKYGADYAKAWEKRTLERLNAWNYNTIGNGFSDNQILNHPDHLPFTIQVTYPFEKALKVGAGRAIWDVFDPKWEEKLEFGVKRAFDRYGSDPKLIGFYMDNELGWGNSGFDTPERLPRYVLGRKGEVPAKKALVDYIRKKYSSIEDLNRAWRTDFSSWNELEEKPAKLPAKSDAELASDLTDLMRYFAETYYKRVQKAMREFAPKVLYLGDRYNSHPKLVIEIAAKYCDVVSSNHYEVSLGGSAWEFLKELDKPFMVSEFHFGSLDRGSLVGGLVSVGDQEERGRAYEKYMDSLLEMKVVVGATWFMYIDEPTTGSSSNEENYNSGLVSQVDNPYPEMEKLMRTYNDRLYSRRGR